MDGSRKRNFLIAAGAVAVALVVVITMWPPAVEPEDARGAIGAVQKHRAQQITSQDVILGDESSRREAKIAFADYLDDAAKLQSFAADLGTAVQVDNRQQLQSFAAGLESHSLQLQSRYVASMTEALGAASELMNRGGSALSSRQLANLTAELQSISTDLNAQLTGSAMQDLSNRLANTELQLSSAFAEHSLGNAELQLASALDLVQNRGQLGSDLALQAIQQLESITLDSQALLGISLHSRSAHLGAMALQAMTLENSRRDLASALDLASAVTLDSMALESRLASISDSLGQQALALESAALQQLDSRLASRAQMASAIQSLQSRVGAVNLQNLSLDSRSLKSFQAELASFSTELASFADALQARSVASMQAELASIANHLQHVSQLESRLNSAIQLESRRAGNVTQLDAKLANAVQLDAKLGSVDQMSSRLRNLTELSSKLMNRQSLASFQTYLGNLSASLDSSAHLGAYLGNQEVLANRARELQSRTSALQSRVAF